MAVELRVERITRILDVSDAEEHIDSTKVAPTDLADLAAWKKIDSRAMLIIMDGVKDHIVPHLYGKKTTAKMWTTLESVPKQEREPEDGVAREDVQHQDGQGTRSGTLSHEAYIDRGLF